MTSGFTIVGYPEDDDPPVVYLEYVAGGALVEHREDVRRFEDMFAEVLEVALPPAKSAMLIKSQVRALECAELDPMWRKSSFSGNGANECVECADLRHTHAVRDSKNPTGPTLTLGPAAWRGLLALTRSWPPSS